mmetsp:Transcript_36520/g.65336  ORF Transcript_36520/g.65336 Transcript_36520/m.65336 type:complete len:281 (-) Transcript_36520:53-895(-)
MQSLTVARSGASQQPAAASGCIGLQTRRRFAVLASSPASKAQGSIEKETSVSPVVALPRRAALAAALAAVPALALAPRPAQAVMGMTAGRVPGLTPVPGREGYETYIRPEGKSGGHGIGWSEIPQYKFTVPEGWEEQPVSIADLGGTEIDIRFSNDSMGELAVVVAPVLRFMDVGFNAQVSMKDIGEPERVLAGFAPELWGQPLDEGDVLDTQVLERDGLTYYRWEVKPVRKPQRLLITATATRNRLFIMLVGGNSRQWRKASSELAGIVDSFVVPPPEA